MSFDIQLKNLMKQINGFKASEDNSLPQNTFYLNENQIFAREALDKYQTKADFLAKYMEEKGYSEALFVDDNSNNLTPCKKYPQIKTILASWGNIAPEDKGLDEKETIEEINKFFNF